MGAVGNAREPATDPRWVVGRELTDKCSARRQLSFASGFPQPGIFMPVRGRAANQNRAPHGVDKWRAPRALCTRHFRATYCGAHCYRGVTARVNLPIRVLQALALVLAMKGAIHAADIDWTALGNETADLLASLIRIDTTNPPGNETPAAEVLRRKLADVGIDAKIIESAPGRGNLYARLAGAGTARPIVLLAHLDVVPAEAARWSVPPFGGDRRDGFVYGRGALDAKGVAAVQAMAVVALARSAEPLPRDVILLATAGEETGGQMGAGWLVDHRPDLVAGAEYLLTEGDHIHARASGTLVQIDVAEKTPYWIRLVAEGEAGHGSAPARGTAVTRLVRALGRVIAAPSPIIVTASVQDYFSALAPLEREPLRTRLAHLATSLRNPAFRTEFLANHRQSALVHNTVTPTVLDGSRATNVIPAEASANLDCRLLPGADPKTFATGLERAIGDPGVRIEPLLGFASTASPGDSGMVRAVRVMADADLHGAPVVPSVITGFTDSHWFRSLGIASYGFVPFVLDEQEQRTVHGTDERVSIENLTQGVRRLLLVLRALPATS
jgi:acetylornithine deacetylase/succinyl-diaminopimelate desuccinylase-like protein